MFRNLLIWNHIITPSEPGAWIQPFPSLDCADLVNKTSVRRANELFFIVDMFSHQKGPK